MTATPPTGTSAAVTRAIELQQLRAGEPPPLLYHYVRPHQPDCCLCRHEDRMTTTDRYGVPHYQYDAHEETWFGADHDRFHDIGDGVQLRAWLAARRTDLGPQFLRSYGVWYQRDAYGNPTRRTRYWTVGGTPPRRLYYHDWKQENAQVRVDLIEIVEYAPVPPPPPPPPFKIGERIWRPVLRQTLQDGTVKLLVDEPEFTQRDGSWSFRACPVSDTAGGTKIVDRARDDVAYYLSSVAPDPEHTWVASLTRFGLVCFSRQPVPENWTYFEVVGLAKNHRAAFVKPVAGDLQELLAQYHTKE